MNQVLRILKIKLTSICLLGFITIWQITTANAEILFTENFESYSEGSNLFGQGEWAAFPFDPSQGTTTLVGTGSGLGTKVSNGLLNPGTGDFAILVQRIEVPKNSDVYTLSFDAYAYSSHPHSHVALLGFTFNGKQMTWQSTNNPSIPTNSWQFKIDNITGDHADNMAFQGGFDKPVKFEIVVDSGKGEFFGRYDFGSGFNETPHYSITQSQLNDFDGIILLNDYRRPSVYLGIEVDNISLKNQPSNPVDCINLIITRIIELNLQQGISNSLDAKLDAAINALDDMNQNNNSAAINALYAFINSVEAQSDKKIPASDADDLIESAQTAINKLTNTN